MEKPAKEAASGPRKSHDALKYDSEGQASSFGAYVRIFTYAGPVESAFLFIALVAALASGVALAMVNLVFGTFITVVSDFVSGSSTPEQFRSQVGTNSLYFVYIGVGRLVLAYAYSAITTLVSHRIVQKIRRHYLRAALSQDIAFFDRGTAGSIAVQATSNGSLIQLGIAEKLGSAIQSFAAFVAAFTLAFATQWKLTLITSSVVPVLLVVILWVSGLEASIETRMLRCYAQGGALAEGILSNPRTVHAFGIRARLVAKYEAILTNASRLGMKKNPMYGCLFSCEFFLVYAGFALAFWRGTNMFASGEIPQVGDIFTVLLSVVIGATSITNMAPNIMSFTRASSAAAELFHLIDRPSRIDPLDPTGEKPINVEGDIEFLDVSFAYPTRPGVPVLRDFSLKIPKGKVTALVGASGSGKSTVIGLLERWYNPTSGTIKLDGRPIDTLNLNWIRKTARLVQQEPVLFNGTVFENISHGLAGTTWEQDSAEDKMKRVVEASKLAFAHDFISQLPKGYDTKIGERGGLLSGGQKQRIAIARSIVSQPKVLLLDEATSALDPHAEGIVQQALNNASRNRTTVTVAHKMSTIKDADNIVVMAKGCIVEQGTHEQLMSKDAAYARLVKAQSLSTSTSDVDLGNDTEPRLAALTHQPTNRSMTIEDGFNAVQNRDDYGYHIPKRLMSTIFLLIKDTPMLRWWYVLLLVGVICGGATFPAQTLIFANIVSAFQLEGSALVSRGNFLALMFFVVAIGNLIIYFVLGWTTNVISQTMSFRYRRQLLDRFLSQDLQFFDRPENTVGALASRLGTYPQAVLDLMGINVALIGIAVGNISACAILSIVATWKLGLVVVLCGLPPLVLSGWVRARLESRMEISNDLRYSNSASIASEAISAIRTVSSLTIESTVLEKYRLELQQAASSSVLPIHLAMLCFGLTQSIEYFFLALGFWYGCRLVSFGEITLYNFFLSFIGVFFAGQAGAQLFTFSTSISKGKEAANYIFWMQHLQPMITDTDKNRRKGPQSGVESIQLQKLEFSYPHRSETRVLRGISARIEKGQFHALVGASGCGKSTIIAMLERFYDPTRGVIEIDGESLPDLSPWAYRKCVSLVQQEPTLYQGTVRENISLGTDEKLATDEQIERVCRAANAWEFVASLPEGMETQCGNNGSQFSGGQRQRIAIARALLREPRVLLLDEATSALDTESEKIVQEALAKAAATSDRITIAVAHRLSTVRDADKIHVFHGGKIVESGSHSDLLAHGKLYPAMCEAQGIS